MVLAVLAAVVSFAAVAGAFVQLPYDTVEPGKATSVEALLAVDGHPVFPSRGEILFTTVSVLERINAYEYLRGQIDPEVDVVPERRIRGDIDPDEFRRLNVEAMADSKTVAELLALRYLGFDDLVMGARVLTVNAEMPVSGVLAVGDVIVEVGGAQVGSVTDVVNAVRARGPGDTLDLVVERAGSEAMAVDVEIGADADGSPLLGVLLTAEVELPFDIEIDSGKVVGSSAGLAYALSLLDYLTPGEITGGTRVGVTGQLAPDGTVAAVGGVKHKALAVARAGGEMFIVPLDNEDEARAAAPDGVEVVAVASLDEALEALSRLPGSNAAALLSTRVG